MIGLTFMSDLKVRPLFATPTLKPTPPDMSLPRLFLAPRLFVEIGKRNFAISLIDSVHASAALRVQETFRFGAVRSRDAILLIGDGLALFIEQFDFNPVTCFFFGRTCRIRQGLSTGTRLNERNAGLRGSGQGHGSVAGIVFRDFRLG